jgi:hypothetical protein
MLLLLQVYVFVGGQYPFDAFMLCLQERELLESGDYMIITINDEFSNKDVKIVQESSRREYESEN